MSPGNRLLLWPLLLLIKAECIIALLSLSAREYEGFIKQALPDEHSVVLFQMPGCTWCKRFMKTYRALEDIFDTNVLSLYSSEDDKEQRLKFAEVDITRSENQPLLSGIRGYPTSRLISSMPKPKVSSIEGDKSLSETLHWIAREADSTFRLHKLSGLMPFSNEVVVLLVDFSRDLVKSLHTNLHTSSVVDTSAKQSEEQLLQQVIDDTEVSRIQQHATFLLYERAEDHTTASTEVSEKDKQLWETVRSKIETLPKVPHIIVLNPHAIDQEDNYFQENSAIKAAQGIEQYVTVVASGPKIPKMLADRKYFLSEVSRHLMPLVSRYSAHLSSKMWISHHPLLIWVRPPTTDQATLQVRRGFEELFLDRAKFYVDSFRFVITGSSTEAERRLVHLMMGNTVTEDIMILELSPNKVHKAFKPTYRFSFVRFLKGINVETPWLTHSDTKINIDLFLQDYKKRRLRPEIKSQPGDVVREQNSQVYSLPGSKALTWIWDTLEERKAVLLDIYAPWCGHCRIFEPIYKQIAEALIKSGQGNRLNMAKLDATLNDLPFVDIKRFPTIVLFDATHNLYSPPEFIGNRSPELIIDWIARYVPSIDASKWKQHLNEKDMYGSAADLGRLDLSGHDEL